MITMNQTRSLSFLFALSLCFLPVFQCMAQTSDFKIVADPYQVENGVFKQWNNDMIRIGITTEERGLIFKITISNQHETNSLTIENLSVDIKVKYGDEIGSRFSKEVSLSYIYLPPKYDYDIFVPVDFGHGDIIGNYAAELNYQIGYGDWQQIEPYPFEFRVVSEEQFQKEIEQKKGSPIIIIGPFEVKLLDFSISVSIFSVSAIIIGYYLWKKKH